MRSLGVRPRARPLATDTGRRSWWAGRFRHQHRKPREQPKLAQWAHPFGTQVSMGKAQQGEDMSNTFDNLVSSIADEIQNLDDDARRAARDSQSSYRENLKEGEVVIEFGEYEGAGNDAVQRIAELDRAAYQSIERIIEEYMASANRRMTEPATADEVATVSLALSREGIDGDELLALYDRYKGNYQLATAIAERASKAHVAIPDAPKKLHRQDALQYAGSQIIGRHGYYAHRLNKMMLDPESTAEGIVKKLTHTDVFGRTY